MRRMIALVALATTGTCYAGNWTQWAVPTRVDVVRNEGVMVYGNFGNPNSCTVANQFFVALGHPQYNEIYAMLMLAFTTGKSVQAYADQCAPEMWYSVASTTYNYLDPCCSINLSN
jgi:hypothetical protein